MISYEEAIEILKATGCADNVIQHCIRVSEIARKLALGAQRAGVQVDISTIEIGALLHDIGRAKSHSVNHGVIGARILRDLKLPEELAKIAERAVGSGIPPDEAKKLGLPVKDYTPVTIEEKIVNFADKVTGSRGVKPFYVVRNHFVREFGSDSIQVQRLDALFEEIRPFIEQSELALEILREEKKKRFCSA